MNEPLIYTTRGNVPLSSVHRVARWEDSADTTVFIEEYHATDGEVIKRSVDVLSRKGLAAVGEQAG